MTMEKQHEITKVNVNVGQGVLYNGTEVYHSISKQTQNCKRIVLIVPLYENNKQSFFGSLRECLRNITHKNLSL
jgi:hypothetical protein